ncbi:LapA family protein [Nitrosospira briensis]|uniref:Putative membrane protein n=1 Tax=Nitrosospira briensis TaxID=35799 RepID=A0A1I5CQ56_9PROT|nr:LapA family protein [Nitrosospira briensis]SFN88996.1 putative membrane protein [Nitrosospira briensis]SFO10801.1 putative membrane protein [Nitrosospira briensis]
MQLQLIAALIIVFLIVTFAVQNAVSVSVIFFLWRVDASLATVIAACFTLGTLIGALVTVPTMLRERISISRLRKQVEMLHAENEDLRALKKDDVPAVPHDIEAY